MGKIGTGELVLILIIALIVVGPTKLPELGKALGKTLNEFKKVSKEFKEDLTIESTPKKVEKEVKTEKIETEKVETALKEEEAEN
jgi:Tat protein translocase TatB subunit